MVIAFFLVPFKKTKFTIVDLTGNVKFAVIASDKINNWNIATLKPGTIS
jgi:hypothetical protein